MVSGASVAGSSSAGDPALARERLRSALSRSRCVPYPQQPHEPRPGRQSENQQHDHARDAEDGNMPRRPPHRCLQGLAPAERERRRNERHEEGPPRSVMTIRATSVSRRVSICLLTSTALWPLPGLLHLEAYQSRRDPPFAPVDFTGLSRSCASVSEASCRRASRKLVVAGVRSPLRRAPETDDFGPLR